MSSTVRPSVDNTRGPGRPRDEDVRKRILESAASLIEEVGFSGITVDAIAERAGASKATIYRWWPNKASVMTEAFRDAVASQFPFANTGSLAGDISEQLRLFSKFLIGGKGRLLAAFVVGAQTDLELAIALRELWIMPLRERGRKVLRRYCESGELAGDCDLDLLMDVMYAPMYYNLLTGYRPISESYAEALTRAVLDGFKISGVSAPKPTESVVDVAG